MAAGGGSEVERLDVIGRRKKSPSEGPTKNTRPGLFKDPVCETKENTHIAEVQIQKGL